MYYEDLIIYSDDLMIYSDLNMIKGVGGATKVGRSSSYTRGSRGGRGKSLVLASVLARGNLTMVVTES